MTNAFLLILMTNDMLDNLILYDYYQVSVFQLVMV